MIGAWICGILVATLIVAASFNKADDIHKLEPPRLRKR
ncbi:hypothetical protein PAMA110636_25335 [Paenibacillus macerans]